MAVTDHLLPYPLAPVSISQSRVDYVVETPRIGDPAGILSGTTRPTEDPERLAIASAAAGVVGALGLLEDGFSYQTGAGGASWRSPATSGGRWSGAGWSARSRSAA